jgi:predicted transcriptional regulator
MSNIGELIGGFKNKVDSESTVSLTPIGKSKAEQASVAGPRYDILAHLSENGPSSVREIAEELHRPSGQVKHLIKSLIKDGYVRRTSGE